MNNKEYENTIGELQAGCTYVFKDDEARELYIKDYPINGSYVRTHYKDGFYIDCLGASGAKDKETNLYIIDHSEIKYFKLKEEPKMNFTKKDLKAGMIVVTRDDCWWVVLSDKVAFQLMWSDPVMMELRYIHSDLKHSMFGTMDIVKVYIPKENITTEFNLTEEYLNLIWEEKQREVITLPNGDKYYADDLQEALSKINKIGE